MPAIDDPIWGTPATHNGQTIQSARTGGEYKITGTAQSLLQHNKAFTIEHRKLLTTWMVRQRKSGILPRIDSNTLEMVATRSPMSFSEKVDAALEYLAENIRKFNTRLALDPNKPEQHVHRLMALLEAEDVKEPASFFLLLEEMQLVRARSTNTGAGYFNLAAKGWERIDALKRSGAASSQAFVAMWFSDETEEAYQNGIAPAISSTGWRPMRIDRKEHNNKIDDEIVAEIRRSHFLVADFTSEPQKPRGGVYFEAGFAMGLNIPVIWTCRESSISDVHFDTRQYSHVLWKTPEELKERLQARIGAVIGDGPLPRN